MTYGLGLFVQTIAERRSRVLQSARPGAHSTTATTPIDPTYASPQLSVGPGGVAPSTIYKDGIPLFRGLFSLLRVFPSWKLFRKLQRRMSTPHRNGNLTIQLQIRSLDDYPTDTFDFGKSGMLSF